MAEITKIGWSIKIDGKLYGELVNFESKLKSSDSPDVIREQIHCAISQHMEVLTQQAIATAQKIITGDTDTQDKIGRIMSMDDQ
ncbi:MAG TPA: hypothetical protein ENI23_12070 [bacterium]|nr:hypothetical protein [bacterium]